MQWSKCWRAWMCVGQEYVKTGTLANSSSKFSIRRFWAFCLPIIAGISFFKWPMMWAWILACRARFTNSFIWPITLHPPIITDPSNLPQLPLLTILHQILRCKKTNPSITWLSGDVLQISQQVILLPLKKFPSNWAYILLIDWLIIEGSAMPQSHSAVNCQPGYYLWHSICMIVHQTTHIKINFQPFIFYTKHCALWRSGIVLPKAQDYWENGVDKTQCRHA